MLKYLISVFTILFFNFSVFADQGISDEEIKIGM